MHFQNTHQQKDSNMCRLCNEALQAAAHSASMLASAAKDLYAMNDHVNSKILADAAAELFKPAQEDRRSAEGPFTAGETAGPVKGAPEAKVEGVQLPRGIVIDDDGVVSIAGVALGHVVVLGKPTKH